MVPFLQLFSCTYNIYSCYYIHRVVYERTRWNPVLLTFIVSAIWHGFYPGYYVAFVYIALLTIAGRKVFYNNKIIFIFLSLSLSDT